MISYILLVLNAFSQLFLCAAELKIFSDDFIDQINRGQSLWRAGKNWGGRATKEYLQALTTTADPNEGEKFPFKKPKERGIIPKFFDSRERWPYCQTMRTVPNQGKCGNCWAAALSITLSCRYCVQSRGRYDYVMSIDHLTRCCGAWLKKCVQYGHGCYGSHPNYFYRFWLYVGTVSGGYFESEEGCRPYSDELFNHYLYYPPRSDGSPSSKIQCIKRCSNEDFLKPFHKDLVSGYDVNYLGGRDPIFIQLEIMNNGPVQAIMRVYDDFKTYQNGIYFHQPTNSSQFLGWHSVMIIGWGEEQGVKYWLGCNTWGTEWGTLGGHFKIKRGNNECDIEANVFGPLFGFGRRSSNKTVKIKTDKTSSSMAIRIENFVIVINFLVPVTINILNFN